MPLGKSGPGDRIIRKDFPVRLLCVKLFFSLKNTFSSCRIPGCDDGLSEYKPEWLSHAVPYVNGVPTRCTRYESTITNSSQCWDENAFDVETVIACDDWVYETEEKTILNEVKVL